MPNVGDSIRNRDASQVGAFSEGSTPDAGDAITNFDTRQAGAFLEGESPDAGDRHLFNEGRNDQIAGG